MLLNYIKIAWKVLLRHPFYTFITLFGISLTLTVLMVLTSFLDHLFGAHYPENKRERLLYVGKLERTNNAGTTMTSGPASFRFLNQYVKSLKTPEAVGICSNFGFSNTYVHGKKIKLNTKYTNSDFWKVTDFQFLEGKPYNDQNIKNSDFAVVITDGLRDQYFDHGGQSVIGKYIEIESINYKVIGVVKGSPATRLYTYSDVYFPYTLPKSNYDGKGVSGPYIAMILAGKTSDKPAIQSEFNHMIKSLPKSEWDDSGHFDVFKVQADSFFDHAIDSYGSRNIKQVYIIFGIIIFMIVGLPVVNLVNVNVSRILDRASEIGVRKAFGAPAKTLLWQFVIENIFITLIGGAFALIISFIIIQMINSSGWIAYADLSINFTVFIISLVVCLIFGLLSGVVPAFRMSKLKIADALKS